MPKQKTDSRVTTLSPRTHKYKNAKRDIADLIQVTRLHRRYQSYRISATSGLLYRHRVYQLNWPNNHISNAT